MNDAVITQVDTKTGMQSLPFLGAMAPIAPGPVHAPQAQEDVSVAGVMLLSAMSVLMTIMAMVTLALFVLACWWLLSHVPVPAVVHQLLSKVHLSRD